MLNKEPSALLWLCLQAASPSRFRRLAGLQTAVLCVAFLSPPLRTQTPAPSAAQVPHGPEPILVQTVRRVLMDVVVTGADGLPVRGLQASDFHVLEDGKPQTIRQFEAHTREDAAAGLPARPALPPRTYMNLPAAPEGGPLTVILYDVLNTPLDAQAYPHQEIVKFLKSGAARRQTAIFVLSDHLHLLQGFTDNQEELLNAMSSKGASSQRSALLQDANEDIAASQTVGDAVSTPNGAAPAGPGANPQPDSSSAPPANLSSALTHMESLQQSALLDLRVETTLEALAQVARFLSGVPGRKNLIWLSGSFPAGVAADSDAAFGAGDALRNFSEPMKRASDLLESSQVAVYPVDVRGLKANPVFDASARPSFAPGSAGVQASTKAVQDFSAQLAAEHATMSQIGEQTGGRAFLNTNGLDAALQAAAQDGGSYYSLTYAPTNRNFDGGLRRIQLTLDCSGCRLAYRRSYFADDLDTGRNKPADLASEQPAPGSLAGAMQYGAPPAHDLVFYARVDPIGDPAPATPGQMDALLPYLELAARVNHRKFAKPQTPVQLQRYVVQYAVLARSLSLPAGSDHVYQPKLTFAVLAFDGDGDTLSGIQTTVEDAIPASKIDDVETNGYREVQVAFVPVAAASLRLAVEDQISGRIGSLEVHLPLPAAAKTSPSGAAP